MTEIISRNPEETFETGRKFATGLAQNSVVGLYGNLGSGKTVFVKGICDYFNVKNDVNSPTFIIVNEYKGFDNVRNSILNIYHFDLYRIKNLKELLNTGFENYLAADNSLCLIEWPELADEYKSVSLVKVNLSLGDSPGERIIKY